MNALRKLMTSGIAAFAVVGLLCIAPNPAQAADHDNLEDGLPIRIKDAYPLAYRGREIQIITRYDKLDAERDDRLTLQPRLEFSPLRNWQFEVGAPFHFGEADDVGSGNTEVEALYNFNTETLDLPAFAIAGGAVFPTGEDSEGVDTSLEFIVTKTVDNENLGRVHLNLKYAHKFDRADDERKDRYAAVIGYSRRVGPDTVFLTDLLREQNLEEGKEINLLEAGLRHQMDPLTVLSAGAGVGIGDDSPDVRVTFGFQRSF